MHRAGTSALTQLLRYDPPEADHRTIPCPRGRSAHYKELRCKTVLTVLGPVELRRPYYHARIARKDSIRLTPNWASLAWNPRRA